MSFSDTLPENSSSVETLEITVEETPAADAAEALQEMRETTDRMAADRRERERHRAEMRQWQVKTAAQQHTPNNTDYSDYTFFGHGSREIYYRYPIKHFHWPRPEHPIIRPPLRPLYHRTPIGDFPAPHIRPLFTPRTRGSSRQ